MKKLELKFLNQEGKAVTYSLENPIEPVNPVTVKAVMDEIIAQNAFTTSGGDVVSIKGARVVERIVQVTIYVKSLLLMARIVLRQECSKLTSNEKRSSKLGHWGQIQCHKA
ncbi:DUF2922 family protein [Virgibacillus doumboii]|uniref:DUF2922 family protein n=1 Tax=Virgibacillus doumboii TaxID=2697503 RepID=UPI0013DF7ACF